MTTDAQPRADDLPRPIGFVQPVDDRAKRAVAALNERRLDQARRHIEAIDESRDLGRMWKLLLDGKLHCEEGRFAVGESALRRAAALALEFGLPKESDKADAVKSDSATAVRIAAAAMEGVGLAQRRQDRPTEARKAHAAAAEFRDQYGSFEEQWQSKVSLGLTAMLLRDTDEAEQRFRSALRLAAIASEQPSHKQALVWGYLANLLTTLNRPAEAVDAARNARDAWRRHDPGSLVGIRASLQLAEAMIHAGESRLADDAAAAESHVREAVELLESINDEISAFGDRAMVDSARRDQLLDFAQRLLNHLTD